MKVHREVLIRAPKMDDAEIIQVFRRFAEGSPDWTFMESQSRDYTAHSRCPSCMLRKDDHSAWPAVAFARKRQGTYFIPNIVPRRQRELSLDEYNAIAESFVEKFRCYTRTHCAEISVRVTKKDIDLTEIIRGKKLRQRFEAYLNGYPRTFHPSDLHELDTFTCYLFRSPHAKVDLFRVESYLVKDLEWTGSEAAACVSRIRTGLDILAVRGRL